MVFLPITQTMLGRKFKPKDSRDDAFAFKSPHFLCRQGPSEQPLAHLCHPGVAGHSADGQQVRRIALWQRPALEGLQDGAVDLDQLPLVFWVGHKVGTVRFRPNSYRILWVKRFQQLWRICNQSQFRSDLAQVLRPQSLREEARRQGCGGTWPHKAYVTEWFSNDSACLFSWRGCIEMRTLELLPQPYKHFTVEGRETPEVSSYLGPDMVRYRRWLQNAMERPKTCWAPTILGTLMVADSARQRTNCDWLRKAFLLLVTLAKNKEIIWEGEILQQFCFFSECQLLVSELLAVSESESMDTCAVQEHGDATAGGGGCGMINLSTV